MEQQQQQQPVNIFTMIAKGVETTNLNVVDLFNAFNEMSKKVDAIYMALYPPQTDEEPNAAGDNEK